MAFALTGAARRRGHALLRFSSNTLSCVLNRVANAAASQGTTTASGAFTPGTTNWHVLTVWCDGDTLRLRTNRTPLVSQALNRVETHSASRLSIGGFHSSGTYSNQTNLNMAAMLGVANRLVTQAELAEMEVLAGQKALLTITPTF